MSPKTAYERPLLQSAGWRCLLWLIVAGVFVALFCYFTSPLNPYSGADYDIFRVIGGGWTQGAVPYRDLFDNKGPMLFLLNALGMWLSWGKTGIFLLESVWLAASLELMWRLGRTMGLNGARNLIAEALFLLFYIATLGSGNSCEAWSLPFVLLPLLFALRWRKTGKPMHTPWLALVYGICLGVVAMIRLNNSVIIIAVAIYVSFILLRAGQWRCFLSNVATFVAGVAVIVLPFVWYFAANDALSQFWYASYTYNVLYKQKWGDVSTTRILINAARLLPCLIAPWLAWRYLRRAFWLILLCGLGTFFVFLQGTGYAHYFIMEVPLLYFAVALILKNPSWINLALGIIIYLPFVGSMLITLNEAYACTFTDKYRIQEQNELAALQQIPPAERNRVYLYNQFNNVDFLLNSRQIPRGKYFTQHRAVERIDTFVYNDIRRRFLRERPLWIVATGPITDAELPLQGRYALHDTLPGYYLYRQLP